MKPKVALGIGAFPLRQFIKATESSLGRAGHNRGTGGTPGPRCLAQRIPRGRDAVPECVLMTRVDASGLSRFIVLEVRDRLGASQILQEKASSQPQMEIRLNTTVEEFRGNSKLSSVMVKDVNTGQTEELTPGAVFIFIGLDPNVDFVRGTVDLDKFGFITTSDSLQSSLEGVFAAGDVRAGSTKQVASAVGEGATAALMIRQYLEKTEGSRGYKGD